MKPIPSFEQTSPTKVGNRQIDDSPFHAGYVFFYALAVFGMSWMIGGGTWGWLLVPLVSFAIGVCWAFDEISWRLGSFIVLAVIAWNEVMWAFPGVLIFLLLSFIVRFHWDGYVIDGLPSYGLMNAEDIKRPVWGEAGSHVGSNAEFGRLAEIGAKGEKYLGSRLEKMASNYDQVRLFHGLCFTPGKPGADVDHALVVGKTVYLIDAKNWGYGTYTWGFDRDGNRLILRDGEVFGGGQVHMDAAAEKWRAYLGSEYTVRTMVVVTKSEKYGSYNMKMRGGPFPVVTLEHAISFLDKECREAGPEAYRRLLFQVKAQLQ